MKAFFVNGSPRKNWNTDQALQKAAEGAKEKGFEVETIRLYDYAFKGCVSCFACKIKNSKTNGLCAFRDDLRPVLEKLQGKKPNRSRLFGTCAVLLPKFGPAIGLTLAELELACEQFVEVQLPHLHGSFLFIEE